jgi:hypothetical protein
VAYPETSAFPGISAMRTAKRVVTTMFSERVVKITSAECVLENRVIMTSGLRTGPVAFPETGTFSDIRAMRTADRVVTTMFSERVVNITSAERVVTTTSAKRVVENRVIMTSGFLALQETSTQTLPRTLCNHSLERSDPVATTNRHQRAGCFRGL